MEDSTKQNVVVIVDSGAARPLSERREPNPHLLEVPFNIIGPDESWLDTPDLTRGQLTEFTRLNQLLEVTTSQPSAGQYQEAYLRAINSGATGIVVIPMSSGLSKSISSAETAIVGLRETNPSTIPILIVDCLTTSIAQAMVAHAVVQEAIKGESTAEDIADFATQLSKGTCVAQIFSDLDHLKKGGRLNTVQYIVAGLLHILPLITVNPVDGKLISAGKPRRWDKARKAAIDYALEFAGSDEVEVAIAHYGAGKEHREQLALFRHEIVVSDLNWTGEIMVAPQPLVLSVHSGEGVLGVGVMKKVKMAKR